MPLFNLFKKKNTGPYNNPDLNKIYELLFCDNLALYKAALQPPMYPWDIILADPPDVNKLKTVVTDRKLETRSRTLAYRLLPPQPLTAKELLATIVEVSLPQGLDVVAAFNDGTARYINHAEKLLVWENRTAESDSLISQLLNRSGEIIAKIGPWDKPRRKAPADGAVRLTFLVSDGLYFGEGQFSDMEHDPMASPILNAATELMAYLTGVALKTR